MTFIMEKGSLIIIWLLRTQEASQKIYNIVDSELQILVVFQGQGLQSIQNFHNLLVSGSKYWQ